MIHFKFAVENFDLMIDGSVIGHVFELEHAELIETSSRSVERLDQVIEKYKKDFEELEDEIEEKNSTIQDLKHQVEAYRMTLQKIHSMASIPSPGGAPYPMMVKIQALATIATKQPANK